MSYLAIVQFAAVVLGVIYFALSLVAYTHATPEEKSKYFSLLLLLDPWWPFYGKRYLPAAKQFLFYGKILLPVILFAWVAWWYLQF